MGWWWPWHLLQGRRNQPLAAAVESSSGWRYPLRGTDSPLATRELERPPTPLHAPPTHLLVLGPSLEPLDLAEADGVAMPRLGYVSVGWPLETPDEHEIIRRQTDTALARWGGCGF